MGCGGCQGDEESIRPCVCVAWCDRLYPANPAADFAAAADLDAAGDSDAAESLVRRRSRRLSPQDKNTNKRLEKIGKSYYILARARYGGYGIGIEWRTWVEEGNNGLWRIVINERSRAVPFWPPWRWTNKNRMMWERKLTWKYKGSLVHLEGTQYK